MKRKNAFKFLLDACMMLALTIFFNKRSLGMSFHEIGGLILLATLAFRVLLNYKWVVGVTRKFFSKAVPMKTRIGYGVDAALLVCFALIVISGILISKVVFHFDIGGMTWKSLHYSASAAALILMGVHLGLRAAFLKNRLCRAVKLPKKAAQAVGAVLSAAVFIIGVYSIATTEFGRWLAMPVMALSENAAPEFAQKGFAGGEQPADAQQSRENGRTTEKEAASADGTEHFRRGEGQGEGSGQGQGNAKGKGFRESHDVNVLTILQTMVQFFSIAFVFALMTIAAEKFFTKNIFRSTAQKRYRTP